MTDLQPIYNVKAGGEKELAGIKILQTKSIEIVRKEPK